MARKRTIASRVVSPRAADDFKIIHGIGPITEKRLHGAGIRTFAQLAKLLPEAVASLVPNLSANQVIKQGWVRRARELASAKTESKSRKKEAAASTGRQHYENFTLEFLLDEKNKIRRLRTVHVQGGDVDTGTKWDSERVIDFLARHTGARLSKATSPKPNKSELVVKPPELTERPDQVLEDKSLPPITTEPDRTTPPKAIPYQPYSQPVTKNAVNPIRLLEWITSTKNSNQSVRSLSHDQTFDVKLTLDITEASLPDESQLDVTGTLFAKKLGGGPGQVIGKTQNNFPYANVLNLTIGNTTLPLGLYRLEVFVTLNPSGASPLANSIVNASFQGGLFQVY